MFTRETIARLIKHYANSPLISRTDSYCDNAYKTLQQFSFAYTEIAKLPQEIQGLFAIYESLGSPLPSTEEKPACSFLEKGQAMIQLLRDLYAFYGPELRITGENKDLAKNWDQPGYGIWWHTWKKILLIRLKDSAYPFIFNFTPDKLSAKVPAAQRDAVKLLIAITTLAIHENLCPALTLLPRRYLASISPLYASPAPSRNSVCHLVTQRRAPWMGAPPTKPELIFFPSAPIALIPAPTGCPWPTNPRSKT